MIDGARTERAVLRAVDRQQQRLHELVPGGAHTYARGSDQYPEGMAPVIVRGRGRPGRRTSTATGSSSTAWACARSRSATPTSPWSRRWPTAIADGVSFSPAQRPGAAGGRGVPRAGAGRRDGEVRQERVGRDHGRGQARPGGHRAAAAWRSAAPSPSSPPTTGSSGPRRCRRHPRGGARLTVGFDYNDLDSVRGLLDRHPGRGRVRGPGGGDRAGRAAPGSSRGCATLADRDGFVLVFDEMITGMRWSPAGAQHVVRRPSRTCRPGARRWATASRSRRWPGDASSWSSAGCGRTRRGCSCCPPRTVRRPSGLAAYLAVARPTASGTSSAMMERAGPTLADGGRTRIARGRAGGLRARCSGRPRAWSSPRCDADGQPVAGLPHPVPAGADRATGCWASRSSSPRRTPTTTSRHTVEAVAEALVRLRERSASTAGSASTGCCAGRAGRACATASAIRARPTAQSA